MRKSFCHFVIGAVLIPAGYAQSFEVNTRNVELLGLRFYKVSVFSGYSTAVFLQSGNGTVPIAGQRSMGADMQYGGEFSIGWQRRVNQGAMALRHAGIYTGMKDNTGLNAFARTLCFTGSRNLAAAFAIGRFTDAQAAARQHHNPKTAGATETNYAMPRSLGLNAGAGLASYDRTSSDTYGFAVGSNTSLTGAWNTYTGTVIELNVQSVRLSLAWTPAAAPC